MSVQVDIVPRDSDPMPVVYLTDEGLPVIEFGQPNQRHSVKLHIGNVSNPAGWIRRFAGDLSDVADERALRDIEAEGGEPTC